MTTMTTATTTPIVGKPSRDFFFFFFFCFCFFLIFTYLFCFSYENHLEGSTTSTTMATMTTHHHYANVTNLQPISKPIAATAVGMLSLLWFISYTNVYFKLIYLLMIVWDKRGLETRCFESSGMFFSYFYIFNYTNEYLKVLYLWMETWGSSSNWGLAGNLEGREIGTNGGLRSRVEPWPLGVF